jgi:hypothetical protein
MSRRYRRATRRHRPMVLANAGLRLEPLEDRAVPATFTVTNTGDAGTGNGNSGDLRYCITQADATGGSNDISFANGVTGTAATADLPAVATDLVISGAATINLGGHTLPVIAGVTLTLSGTVIVSGHLDGDGTIATDPFHGGVLANAVIQPSVTLRSNSGADTFLNVSNLGSISVTPDINPATPVVFKGFIGGSGGQPGGAITVGSNSHINAIDFQTYGPLTLAAGTTGSTELTNAGTAAIAFDGGSIVRLSDPADADRQTAGIDLNGADASASGALVVNNGYLIDGSNGGTGTHKLVAHFGSLVKGAGFYQNTVVTPEGGTFQAGNGPGSATFGSFHFSGPTANTGVSDFRWQLNDPGPSDTYPAATGVAGPAPNSAGQVSGWGLIRVVTTLYQPGNFSFDATPTDKLTVNLQSLAAPNDADGNPSNRGTYSTISTGVDPVGTPAEFDPARPYTWPVVTFRGSYTGPTDSATLNASTVFNTGQFPSIQPGRFGWVLVPNTGSDGHLDLVYTPPPQADAPPVAPAPPTAVATGPTTIAVSWSPVGGALNYKLDWSQGPGGPWTQVYYAGGTSFTDDNTSFAHIFQLSTYYYRVLASNAAGDSPYSAVTAVTTPDYPTVVQAVGVNGGSAQRSEVRSITVTFSTLVTFAGGYANAAAAFQLRQVRTGQVVDLSAAVTVDPFPGSTIVTLSFSGAQTDPVSALNGWSPSLADGRYALTVFAANVTGPAGALRGGQPNGDYVSPPDSYGGLGLHLYRLYGDVNGDGVVDATDLGRFRSTFNSNSAQANYPAYLDADNNGAVDASDLGQFRSRFNANVFA